MKRQNYKSNTVWEEKVGYSRAVKTGNYIFVSGTTAVNDNNEIVGLGSVYIQTRFVLQKIEKTLISAGASLKDVVRTRMFVINIKEWEEISKAHAEFFNGINPTATMVEVSNLIEPDLLIEIEVDAVVTN